MIRDYSLEISQNLLKNTFNFSITVSLFGVLLAVVGRPTTVVRKKYRFTDVLALFLRLRGMKVDALIRLIPSERLEQLAVSTRVDYYSKKLQGEIVFRLLLYCLITRKENSLRTIQSAYESITFRALQNKRGISHSSISERLSTIEVSYFEGLFKDCVSAYKNLDGINRDNLLKFDSTIVSQLANLINIRYRLSVGSESVKQIKFTVGYSDIPEVVHFYHEQ